MSESEDSMRCSYAHRLARMRHALLRTPRVEVPVFSSIVTETREGGYDRLRRSQSSGCIAVRVPVATSKTIDLSEVHDKTLRSAERHLRAQAYRARRYTPKPASGSVALRGKAVTTQKTQTSRRWPVATKAPGA